MEEVAKRSVVVGDGGEEVTQAEVDSQSLGPTVFAGSPPLVQQDCLSIKQAKHSTFGFPSCLSNLGLLLPLP